MVLMLQFLQQPRQEREFMMKLTSTICGRRRKSNSRKKKEFNYYHFGNVNGEEITKTE